MKLAKKSCIEWGGAKYILESDVEATPVDEGDLEGVFCGGHLIEYLEKFPAVRAVYEWVKMRLAMKKPGLGRDPSCIKKDDIRLLIEKDGFRPEHVAVVYSWAIEKGYSVRSVREKYSGIPLFVQYDRQRALEGRKVSRVQQTTGAAHASFTTTLE